LIRFLYKNPSRKTISVYSKLSSHDSVRFVPKILVQCCQISLRLRRYLTSSIGNSVLRTFCVFVTIGRSKQTIGFYRPVTVFLQTQYARASKGRFNQIALPEKQHLDHTINEYNDYLIHKKIIKSL